MQGLSMQHARVEIFDRNCPPWELFLSHMDAAFRLMRILSKRHNVKMCDGEIILRDAIAIVCLFSGQYKAFIRQPVLGKSMSSLNTFAAFVHCLTSWPTNKKTSRQTLASAVAKVEQ